MPQAVVSLLPARMRLVIACDQWMIEEYLLALHGGHTVKDEVPIEVPVVPLESGAAIQFVSDVHCI
jgi:hypothetical protein